MPRDAAGENLKAKEYEQSYKWLLAYQSYKKTLASVIRRGKEGDAGPISRNMGYCLYRSAFQAKNLADFKQRLRLASEAYHQSDRFFQESGKDEPRARAAHCRAFAAYLESWLENDLEGRKWKLKECWKLQKEALRNLEKAENASAFGTACNNLMLFLIALLEIEWDAESREEVIESALEYGEKGIAVLSEIRNKHQLAEALVLASYIHGNAAFSRKLRVGTKEESRAKALSYAEKALNVATSLDDAYIIGLSSFRLADAHLDVLGSTGIQESSYFEKALESGLIARDNRIVADALFGLGYAENWRVIVEEDPEEAKKKYHKVIDYSERAVHQYSLFSDNSGIAMAHSSMLYPLEALSGMISDLAEKRDLLQRSVVVGHKGLDYAKASGSVTAKYHVANSLARTIVCLAKTETNKKKRMQLLRESQMHVEEIIDSLRSTSAASRLEPKHWNLAYAHWSLALIHAELADLEKLDQRIRLTGLASTNMQKAAEYWQKTVDLPWTRMEKTHWWFEGAVEMGRGETLNKLHAATREGSYLEEAAEAFNRSAKAYEKAELPSHVAEAYWQAARSYDQQRKHRDAERNFELASEKYSLAAKKTPQLKEFYSDYALYMAGWSEIEKARYQQENEQHHEAEKHYNEVARLLERTKRWKYLTANYHAWAQLERAADLSQNEHTEQARDVFRNASGLFAEARKMIQARTRVSEDQDEKKTLSKLSDTSRTRLEYCNARMTVEEAKILDMNGDHVSSSKKYELAADAFAKIADWVEEPEQDQLMFLSSLCRGWQKMTSAEAQASPILYSEASEVFIKAKKHTSSERLRRLSSGLSQFSRALQAGVQFEDTRDLKAYSRATRHLESASNHYIKGGFNRASEYTKATQRLLDAYMYVDNAKKETDPEKRTRYFLVAERILQTALGSYLKAGHPEKIHDVQALLARVREERELAASLSEVLSAPIIVSTRSFPTPTTAHDEPLGLERLQHAEVQASLTPEVHIVRVGEDFILHVNIANAGKEHALLSGIKRVVPEGFELVRSTEEYCKEHNYLNLRGKKLSPLKSEQIELTLKPLYHGVISIEPRIKYVDELGKDREHDVEPARIEVVKTLPGRIATGYEQLDDLLLGGLPRNYAVLLVSPSSDERDWLLRKFLEAGAKAGEVTFYLTAKASGIEIMAREYQSTFFLFICNPRADSIIGDQPNVYKLKGVENLNDINIALVSALNRLDDVSEKPRRICIDMVSDVLLQHHAVLTRRWINSLIPELKSKSFTALAVLDVGMHQPSEANAVLDLFDGEIQIFKRGINDDTRTMLRIRRLYNQEYSPTEYPFTLDRRQRT